MKKEYDYAYMEELVRRFFEGREEEKQGILEEILLSFQPLMLNLMVRYFKKYDEDLMQSAMLEAIVRIKKYDYKSYHKFCGYMKFFLDLFFKRRLYEKWEERTVSFEDVYYVQESQKDTYPIEIESLLAGLQEKEKYIIEENILKEKSLKLVAEEMDISYVYAKKLKKSALVYLRKTIYF